MHPPGKVILLVGTSCAGKSTLAEAVQARAAEPILVQSLDGLFGATPDAYGSRGAHAHEGFRYELPDGEGGVRRIAYGPQGWRLLQGFHRSVAAYAKAGVNLVVDDMLLDLEVLRDWAAALADVPTLLVKVTADRADLLEREGARARRSTPGLADGHLELHRDLAADAWIDTSVLSPPQAADRLLELSAACGGRGDALERYAPAPPL